MAAALEKITFLNFNAGGICDLFQYGVTWDCLDGYVHFFQLHAGTLNGIVGEFGNGGAVLSYILTNPITRNTNSSYEGQIYIDGRKETISAIVRNSWYIGYDSYGARKPLKRKTIREQIIAGVRESHCVLDADTILDMFELSAAGAGKNIQKAGVERWKASMAIGYAYGKKIFCYPWMNTNDIRIWGHQMAKSIKVLMDHDCTVVVPTTKEENIMKLSATYHLIDLN